MLNRAIWLLLILLSACAIRPPPPEFNAYLAAFEEADAATDDLVRTYAPIEKSVRKPKPEAGENEIALSFDPNNAPYWAASGVPRVSAQISRGFTVVERYNTVLIRYAEGESLQQIKPALSSFTTEVGLLGSVFGFPAAGAAVKPVLDGLQTFADALFAVADRAAFARTVEANTDVVREFLRTLRAITPEIYDSARQQTLARQGELVRADRGDEIAALTEDLLLFRQMLADWILLLERTDESIAALQTAVITGQTGTLTAAELAFWTGELRRHAEEIKLAARAIGTAL